MNDNSTFVTYSNIPLDDEPTMGIGYDSIPKEALEPQQVTVVSIQFKKGGKEYYFDPGTAQVEKGDEVIIDTAKGPEYGFCSEGNHPVSPDKVVPPLRPVIRVATEQDKKIRAEYKAKEQTAFDTCQEKILDHQLDMKLVSAEYSFDGSKILFYFTADGRVDFRDLVKDLAAVFRTRIELRQIGVRDEAKMLGGLGICGRPFCCKQFLDDFQPVSIKMAKTQNLSLNPTKISGTCGRLMCCLKYEQDAYESLIKTSPKVDSIVNTWDGKGTVTEASLLKQTVKVRLDNDPSSVKTYSNCDICVLRSGKGKKTDPPIPEDLPPLPKKEEKKAEPEIALFDESILTGYSAAQQEKKERQDRPERKKRTEKAEKTEKTETTEKAEVKQEEKKEGQGKKNHRNRNKKKPQAKKAESQQEQTVQKTEAPKQDAPKAEGNETKKKSNHRRRYYRGKKPAAKKES